MAGAPGGDRVPLEGGVLCALVGRLAPGVRFHRQPAEVMGPGRCRPPQPPPGLAPPKCANRCALHDTYVCCKQS